MPHQQALNHDAIEALSNTTFKTSEQSLRSLKNQLSATIRAAMQEGTEKPETLNRLAHASTNLLKHPMNANYQRAMQLSIKKLESRYNPLLSTLVAGLTVILLGLSKMLATSLSPGVENTKNPYVRAALLLLSVCVAYAISRPYIMTPHHSASHQLIAFSHRLTRFSRKDLGNETENTLLQRLSQGQTYLTDASKQPTLDISQILRYQGTKADLIQQKQQEYTNTRALGCSPSALLKMLEQGQDTIKLKGFSDEWPPLSVLSILASRLTRHGERSPALRHYAKMLQTRGDTPYEITSNVNANSTTLVKIVEALQARDNYDADKITKELLQHGIEPDDIEYALRSGSPQMTTQST